MNHVTASNKTSGQLSSTDKRSNKSDTFPRFGSNKPPPSPSRDSRISFAASDQSNPTEEFSWSAFTPLSQTVFEKAYTRHKYFYKFSDKVLKQGTKMKTNVWDVPGKPGETMTYEQLLQGRFIINMFISPKLSMVPLNMKATNYNIIKVYNKTYFRTINT